MLRHISRPYARPARAASTPGTAGKGVPREKLADAAQHAEANDPGRRPPGGGGNSGGSGRLLAGPVPGWPCQRADRPGPHRDGDPARADRADRDQRHGIVTVAVRSLLAVTACGLLLGLLVFRRAAPTLLAGGISLAVLVASGGIATATWNPRSIFEPRYTGLLTGAPLLVGNVQAIAVRFGLYRQELADLVGNVTRLYAATSTLPVYQPDPSTIRVLAVSDIHDNPAAWSVMHSIAGQFAVNFIIDSGDLTDHGSSPENELATEIPAFHVPYVFIRGNHDSRATMAAVARQRNAVV